jgi:hypothetical protein
MKKRENFHVFNVNLTKFSKLKKNPTKKDPWLKKTTIRHLK